MKKLISLLLSFMLLLASCAGREAYPVAVHQVGDDNRTCESLKLEIAQNEVLVTKKVKKDENKFWSNAFWLVWFPPAMDVKESEKVEAEALQARNNYLNILIAEKCSK